MGCTGNNEWGSSFVDKNRIHFIDNGKGETALGFVFQTQGHIVAQVVKTKFIVGAIGDIGGIGVLTGARL